MSNITRVSKRPRTRTNRRYGDLVKVAAKISGRAQKTIYAVLEGRAVSAPVSEAIRQARRQILRGGREAA